MVCTSVHIIIYICLYWYARRACILNASDVRTCIIYYLESIRIPVFTLFLERRFSSKSVIGLIVVSNPGDG